MEPKKVLLVDDDELITMSLEMIISAEAEFVVAGKVDARRCSCMMSWRRMFC